MQIFIDKIWEEYNKLGHYKCIKSGKTFVKNKFPDMTPGKLLSYIIQDLETSINEIKFNLEQLRGLDNNYKIMSEYTEYNSISIDNFSQLFKINTN
jgi:hypothetical protein